jgi:hypothetical protein
MSVKNVDKKQVQSLTTIRKKVVPGPANIIQRITNCQGEYYTHIYIQPFLTEIKIAAKVGPICKETSLRRLPMTHGSQISWFADRKEQ